MSAGVGEAADADVMRLEWEEEHGTKHYSNHTPRPCLKAGFFDLHAKPGGLETQGWSHKLRRSENGSE